MQTTIAEVDRLPPIHSLQTLILNASYEPLSTWPLSLDPINEAIIKICKNRAVIVDTWKDAYGNDRMIRSPNLEIPAPKVLALKEYVNISNDPKFTRRSILLRDRYCCQYCGDRFPANDLTFDHLIPRSRGGKTEWTNIVMACEPCNTKKADKMPVFSGSKGKRGSGLRPLKIPQRPTNGSLLKAGLEFLPDQLRQTFGDWLYWSVELEE